MNYCRHDRRHLFQADVEKRIQILDDLGFCFSLSGFKWEDQLETIKIFSKTYDCNNVPASMPALAKWCKSQRAQYRLLKKGKPSAMTQDRIKRLEAIGFKWSTRKKKAETANKPTGETAARKSSKAKVASTVMTKKKRREICRTRIVNQGGQQISGGSKQTEKMSAPPESKSRPRKPLASISVSNSSNVEGKDPGKKRSKKKSTDKKKKKMKKKKSSSKEKDSNGRKVSKKRKSSEKEDKSSKKKRSAVVDLTSSA